MKKRIEPIAGFPKEWSELINKAGFLKTQSGVSVMLAGEDFENNCIWIAIKDVPDWIKAGVKLKLRMPKEDIELLKDYFKKL